MGSPAGLTSQEVLHRQLNGLTNELDTQTSRSLAHIFRTNVVTRFNAILGALFIVIVMTGSLADGLFGIVLVVNTVLGTAQEWKAKRTLDRIRLLHSPTSHVIRDGVTHVISSQDIVQDDVLSVSAGDHISVDGLVLVSDNLEVNESNLTGEADAVVKHPGHTVLSGTFVTAGNATICATAVGKRSYAQRITAEAKKFTQSVSEIQDAINRLLKWMLWSFVVLAPLQVWTQLRVDGGRNWQEATARSVAGLVGIIPEGLVVLTTITFLTAAVALTRQQVLVQQLPAVETLARVSVLCVDKTGTLTTGKMQCESLHLLGAHRERELEEVLGALVDDPAANATLQAIAQKFPPSQKLHIIANIPFDSVKKWKAIETDSGSWFLGAPEVLASNDVSVLRKVQEFAYTGARVLFLGHSTEPLRHDAPQQQVTPAALITIKEHIREDARDTVSFFFAQGVEIYVLSGDHPSTVAAVARAIGINEANVRGRVTPEQKRDFIEQLHKRGEVVAMTGDGVNDVLALKKADIGIAMNNAAPATKAVAEMILLDGKFSHLPVAIAEGRRVIGNLERVAHIFLAKNVMSVFSIISVALLSQPFPFLPRQMTLVSTLAIGIPAFFLAIGKSSHAYTPGFLKRVLQFSIPVGVVIGCAVVIVDIAARDDSGTAASLSALVAFFWVVTVFARPFTWPKAVVLAVLMGSAFSAFSAQVFTELFSFSATMHNVALGLVGGLSAACISEVMHRTRRG
jgi:cation-transporting P-type ATPase E